MRRAKKSAAGDQGGLVSSAALGYQTMQMVCQPLSEEISMVQRVLGSVDCNPEIEADKPEMRHRESRQVLRVVDR
jgi:hypothetical protein